MGNNLDRQYKLYKLGIQIPPKDLNSITKYEKVFINLYFTTVKIKNDHDAKFHEYYFTEKGEFLFERYDYEKTIFLRIINPYFYTKKITKIFNGGMSVVQLKNIAFVKILLEKLKIKYCVFNTNWYFLSESNPKEEMELYLKTLKIRDIKFETSKLYKPGV